MEGLSPTKHHKHWFTMARAVSEDQGRKEGAHSPFSHFQEPSLELRGEARRGECLGSGQCRRHVTRGGMGQEQSIPGIPGSTAGSLVGKGPSSGSGQRTTMPILLFL